MDRISLSKREDASLVEILDKLGSGKRLNHLDRYSKDGKGYLRNNGWPCIPKLKELVDEVLEECHHSKMTIHLRGDKMYRDMRRVFDWQGMEGDVARYVARCLTCQRVKMEQKKPSGLLMQLAVDVIGDSPMEVEKHIDGFL